MCGLNLHKGSFWFSYWSPLRIHSQMVSWMWPGRGWHEGCLVIESWSSLPQSRMGDGLGTELVGRGRPPTSKGPSHQTQDHQVCGQLTVFILHTMQKVTVALCTCTSWSHLCPEWHRLPNLRVWPVVLPQHSIHSQLCNTWNYRRVNISISLPTLRFF